MSLIGSLEDLGLGDILQIISLSRKSGVLAIRSDEGEGRIVFVDGRVRGAAVKGGPMDLRAILVAGGFVGGDDFDAASREAREEDVSLEEALAARASISTERIDSLRREAVEAAVVRMFQWRIGEFSFDVRDQPDPEDPPLFLATGINAQYLAMEGSRIGDEDAYAAEEEADEATELSAAAMLGIASAGPSPPEAAAEPLPESELVPEPAAATAPEGEATSTPAPGGPARPLPPIVVIDPHLPALEWVKQVLVASFPRVHIFQRQELGLTRIRQYLARSEAPVVLLSPDAPGDPLSGIRDAVDFARRLKAQSARTAVLWLRVEGSPTTDRVAPADGEVARPAPYQLSNPGAARQLDGLAERLRSGVQRATERCDEPRARRRRTIAPEVLSELKAVTARLSDASSRGEVLPLVIRFAAQRFSRVAMFVVRDGWVLGMAQHGLDRAGGPDDEGLRAVRVRADECGRVREAIERRTALRSPPRDEGDRALARRLGEGEPGEAYLAPIESAGQVVALLYADNLPGGAPLKDTSALEVVLHHAGLALDRAALERALAEADT
jgi:hypothetical protein